MYLLSSGYQRSGKNSRITIGATNLAFARFDITYEGDDLDTVNFESSGLDEGILGVEKLQYSAGGDWDAGVNAFDSPPGIYPRDDLADLYFILNTNDNTFWYQPYSRIRSARNGSEVRGKVSFEWSGMSQGSFTIPTGDHTDAG